MALERDVICLSASRMTSHLVERGVPIRIHEIPFRLPDVHIEVRWHQRADGDPASQWLRNALRDITSTLPSA
jgi:DNA-binding transcriptional LysR family regulator